MVVALSVAWFSQQNVTQPSDVAIIPIIEKPLPTKTAIDPVDPVAPVTQTATVTGAGAPEKEDKNPGRTANNSRENAGRTASVTARDYGSSPAQSYRQLQQRAGEVSLSAPLKPMVVSMQDDRGETRRISLPPVSFGAQRMVDNNRISVSSTNSRSW